jgi:hypothetical protein
MKLVALLARRLLMFLRQQRSRTMDCLKMIKPEDVQRLVANSVENEPLRGTPGEKRYSPVVKLFNPMGVGTWLLTELEPNSTIAFGLCDLGAGYPEMGSVDLEELWLVRLPGGVKIEQDIYFEADKTLSEYADRARVDRYIRT